ncbi:hypothetical protein CROQUDRAFT_382286 [Cronartium quercuum f. sp. fusiforme G11]|uniref:Uncharacterized protein n=1 Tax=Cronartium quercuum f. sp. fusiforme G11 TaxID=708437 RepID=A0A9P6N729_9BASI|nr:hypothetical protein CROQUDRAFT_382286 [Cronartium quercuum f. sp. fusiforme G11]
MSTFHHISESLSEAKPKLDLKDLSICEKRLPTKLPIELYQQILRSGVEEVNHKIRFSKDLPSSGQARSNRFLASILTLDKGTHIYLQRFLWERLGVYYDEDHTKNDLNLEKVEKGFQANRQYIKVIDSTVLSPHFTRGYLDDPNSLNNSAEIVESFQVFTRLLEGAPADQIQEVTLGLSYSKYGHGYHRSSSGHIEQLLTTISTFKNISTLKFWKGTSCAVPNKILAQIIQRLPSLENVVLKGLFWDGHSSEIGSEQEILGSALASRRHLKSLNIGKQPDLPDPSWLKMEWQGELVELAIDINEDWFPFCSIFRTSLVSLYVAGEPTTAIAIPIPSSKIVFTALKNITCEDFSPLSSFSRCPSVECLTWLLDSFKWQLFGSDLIGDFKSSISLDGSHWPKLKWVNVPQYVVLFHPTFERYLEKYSIRLRIEHFFEWYHGINVFSDRFSALYPRPRVIDI